MLGPSSSPTSDQRTAFFVSQRERSGSAGLAALRRGHGPAGGAARAATRASRGARGTLAGRRRPPPLRDCSTAKRRFRGF